MEMKTFLQETKVFSKKVLNVKELMLNLTGANRFLDVKCYEGGSN